MATRTIQLQVQQDFVERLSSGRPIAAIAELIWNSLDADASAVDVHLNRDELGQLSTIEVVDDGHGMPYAEVESLFGRLGGSWKRSARHSQTKRRMLHGEGGKGRFRAIALGRLAEWEVVGPHAGGLVRYKVSVNRDSSRNITISDAKAVGSGVKSGVRVTVSDLYRNYRLDDADEELGQLLALYLTDYADVSVSFGGIKLDPASQILDRRSFELEPIAGDGRPPARVSLNVVEWRRPVDRHLYLCSESSFPLSRVPMHVQAPGFSFTGYLSSDYISHLNDEGSLDLAEMDPLLAEAISQARSKLREYFKARAAQAAQAVVDEWKRDRVYPYEGEPDTTVATAERQVFDIVAVTATKLIPNFQDSELKLKRFQLRMLRQAIEHGPRELREILTQVLDLPFRRQEELARLLERTSLSSIISASKLVADRLRFIEGLDQMLFRPDLKSDFKERSQLHRLLAEGNTWLFGEEFTLTVDDQGLTEVLRQHLKELGHHAVVDEPVRRLDGSVGIIDLMLTRRVPGPREMEREHLVIELKAPTVALGSKEITQIKSYAFAVAADPRFRDITTRWSFWLVGDDTDAYTKQELRQFSRTSPGLLWMDDDRPSMRIWVKTWGQLLAESRARLTFFQKELNYSLDRDESLEFLRETYAKILSAVNEDDEDAGQSESQMIVPASAASD